MPAENINVLQERKLGNLETAMLGVTAAENINTLED